MEDSAYHHLSCQGPCFSFAPSSFKAYGICSVLPPPVRHHGPSQCWSRLVWLLVEFWSWPQTASARTCRSNAKFGVERGKIIIIAAARSSRHTRWVGQVVCTSTYSWGHGFSSSLLPFFRPSSVSSDRGISETLRKRIKSSSDTFVFGSGCELPQTSLEFMIHGSRASPPSRKEMEVHPRPRPPPQRPAHDFMSQPVVDAQVH